ncbi:pyruvate dehydrogenase complex dihydrolipoamide acetyltransferase [Lujinxingia sediminis]|uniref:Acetyltransferase component of pyruvate dehydrogenase complex n=1 Tax=Lujinxingia sediminis TaxID=2480984 RepID=A0ABY0CW15_9DELT|nr:pyruvate dehydrogenase complex dihydrolipoamide acetyltransferase [Lujinxingia sediminis]RVU48072.1 pyruvate dehydrogenase complex dihydrolipoamide acetyltransferase [Lujinxingia sediminis]
MAEVMEMLALSPTMEEGTLAEWTKAEGDSVAEGDILAEVETDKATMEMESFYAGTVLKLLAEPGQTVRVGDPLVIIGKEGEDISGLLSELGGGGKPAAKAKSEQAAPEKAEAAPEEKESASMEVAEDAGNDDGRRIKASPLARKMAEDKGLDLSTIEGSGPGGRIIKRDIESAKAAPAKAPRAAAAAPSAELHAAAGLSEVPGEQKSLSQMRKTIAKRLVEVWQSTPHFYLTMGIDMAAAMKVRKDINAQLAAAEAGYKVSVNDLIVKAAAAALAKYPAMNTGFAGDSLYAFDEVNIGVAVAIEDGLITPTVRNADQKALGAIAREVRELAGRARDKKLKPEEYSAHTFSISNLGMYDIDEFMAVINPPDAAILACGAVKQVPVVVDGELAVGTRMKLTLACDHRVVDGATGAEFLNELRRNLENPLLLLV